MIPATTITLLVRNEGVRPRRYFDTLGIPTIGVGFNLNRPDAKQRLASIGADHTKIMAGKAELTVAQINALLLRDVEDCLDDLRQLFTDFDTLPATARDVLTDMRFQLGGAGLRGFKNTLQAFRARDWKAAATGMRKSLAYRQTTKRWETNARALEGLASQLPK